MTYFIYDDKKHSISNFKNMEKRCTCDTDHYTLIENPISIILKEGKVPTVFKTTTNEPYSDKKYRSRAISYKGCICELDKISESYTIYGARHPSQYNWGTLEVNKETEKRVHSRLPAEKYLKWTNWTKK
ncbi:hypothetical protein [Peribacillus sp. SCS-155]|uniref:hypothetical protein n=1 Tax=Peribacillus sedimenti TaxID=3115297 RepID=UPI003906479F